MSRYFSLLKRMTAALLVFYSILRYSGGTWQTIRFMHLFLLIPLYLFFSHTEWNGKNRFLSCLFSLFLTIGFSMRERRVFFDQPALGFLELLVFWAGMFISVQAVLSAIDRCIGRIQKTEDNTPISLKSYMTLLLLCWLPYYILIFPGGIWFDVCGELEQFFGAVPFNNINPFLQTILIGSFTYFGRLIGSETIGVGLYIAVQAVFSAYVISNLMITLAELLKNDRKIVKNCLLLYALVPVYPLYVLAVGKDLNWSMSILLSITHLIRIFFSPDDFFSRKANVFAFGGSLILVTLLRNSGLPVAILLAVLSLQCLPQLKRRAAYSTGVGMFAVFILFWHTVLLPQLNVSTVGNAKENYSVPLLQIGRAMKYYPEDFSAEDELVIGRVVDIDAAKYSYVPDNSDTIKETFNNDATAEEINDFINVYKKEFKKRPMCYIDAMIAKSYAYFDPDDIGCVFKPFAVASNYAAHRLLPLGIDIHYLSERMTYIAAGIISRSRYVPVLSAIVKCGMWIWIYLYCLARNMKKLPTKYMTLFAPGVLIMIGLIFTPINGYFRYALPIVTMVPAAVLICFRPQEQDQL